MIFSGCEVIVSGMSRSAPMESRRFMAPSVMTVQQPQHAMACAMEQSVADDMECACHHQVSHGRCVRSEGDFSAHAASGSSSRASPAAHKSRLAPPLTRIGWTRGLACPDRRRAMRPVRVSRQLTGFAAAVKRKIRGPSGASTQWTEV